MKRGEKLEEKEEEKEKEKTQNKQLCFYEIC